MFLSERMRRSPRPAAWRWLGLIAFPPLIYAATTRSQPIEAQVGEFWGTAYEAGCVALVLAGLLLRAALASCHSLARDQLDASGFYSLTRNPVYLANSMILVGIMLYTQDVALAVASALFLAVYYERTILREEARLFKRFGMAFVGWATLTPVFLPRLTGWRPPSSPFNPRAIMRREPIVWLGAMAALATIALVSDRFSQATIDELGLLLLLAAAMFGAGLSVVARHAGILDDPKV